MSHMIQHIARGTTISPFVSMSRSYGVACGYAMNGNRLPRAGQPAYVYRIVIDEHDGHETKLVDPVITIAAQLQSPYDWKSYHHDGEQSFLLGIVDPTGHKEEMAREALFPPGELPTPRPPQLHAELEALVRALRDAEVLALGRIAKAQVKERWEVY